MPGGVAGAIALLQDSMGRPEGGELMDAETIMMPLTQRGRICLGVNRGGINRGQTPIDHGDDRPMSP